MSSTQEGFRESVNSASRRWAEGRDAIKEIHQNGGTGRVVTRRLSDLLDPILINLYKQAIADISPELATRVSLVLLGGTGRQDIAPYSDVDLMVLYQGTLTEEMESFSRRIAQDITDAGFALGFSLRTPREALSMSIKDAYIFSSITEARFLVGSQSLFENFMSRFRRLCEKSSSNIIKAIIEARNKERVEYGETVYLLRPNVKRSRGGLRDIHLIRWLGYVRYGVTDIVELLKRGGISTADSTQLMESQEFLLRLRNEMHFFANKLNDGLGRNEQVRMAELFGYRNDDALMSVENFMREYFRCTSRIVYISDHFVSKMVNRSRGATAVMLSPVVTRQVDEHFRIGPTEIGVVKNSLDIVKYDLEQVLRLMQLSCLYGKKIEHETWVSIRHAMLKFPDVKFTRETARRFMALLSNTVGLGRSLRRLHEMQVLRTIVPDFDHARGLLQFNEYHMFTVDEHSMQAVENAIAFEKDKTIVGKTYREIRDKNLLHLALLIHDLGKGFPEDHSVVGARIAESLGERFDLPDEDTECIRFLVLHHLVMSHLAFHRDINDQQMVAEFASNVGSVELLAKLFVLTCADISAVGPGVLNPWKLSLLTDLFRRATQVLNGDSDGEGFQKRFEKIYEGIALHSDDARSQNWLRKAAKNLPNNYVISRPPQEVAERLLSIENIQQGKPICWVQVIEDSNLYEVCLVNVDHRRSGNFYRLTGAISSLGLQIRSADIKRLSGEMMFFWFQFEDGDYSQGSSPPDRLEQIRVAAIASVAGEKPEKPKFRKVWGEDETRAVQLSRPAIQVKINNQTVDHATIIDVFAYDKTGLLYQVSKQIYKLGLDVTYARISTYAHQVIDVFYVTDDEGNKIRNLNQIQIIRKEIYNTVRQFLEPDTVDDKNSTS
jgi:[protein-PII] uridylyltransferase